MHLRNYSFSSHLSLFTGKFIRALTNVYSQCILKGNCPQVGIPKPFKKYLTFLVLLSGTLLKNHASAQECPNIPVNVVDLTSQISYTSPPLSRGIGTCCGISQRSVQFKIILAPNSLGITFAAGDNSGSYTVNCVPQALNNQSLCLTGRADGIYYVIYSKAGANLDTYTITAVPNLSAASNSPTNGGAGSQLCEGSTLNLTSSTIPGATYNWTGPNRFTSILQNPSISSPSIAASGTYRVTITNVSLCSASATATATTDVTINAVPVSPISGGDQAVCETGSAQTLTATASVPTGLTIDWYDASVGGNLVSLPTYNGTLAGSKTFYAEAINPATLCKSGSRTPVTLTITAAPAAPSSNGNITQCETSPIQTLNANNAFTLTTGITWYSAPTGGSVITSPVLSSIGTITYYAQYSNGTCSSVSRTPVTLTITPAPAAPSSNGNITQCETSPIQTLNANNAFTSTTGITWYSAPTGGSVITSPVLSSVGTVTYYAQYSNGTCSSVSRTPVTLTITAAPAAPSSNGNITQCETAPIQTLNANNAFTSTTGITWYSAPTGGSVITSPVLSSVGAITYYAQYSNGTCSSVSRTPVTLTITSAPAAPSSNGNITQCETSPIQTLNANNAFTSTTGITWYSAPTGGSVITSPVLSSVGAITYYAQYSNGTCSSVSRTPVTLTITAAPTAPSSNGNITQCETAPIQMLNANNAFTSTTGITWYSAPTGGSVITSPVLSSVGTVTYYAEAKNNSGCTSLTRTAVKLTILAAPMPPTASSNNITQCETRPIQTLDARSAIQDLSGITWYSAANGGVAVSPPILNSVGTITYYAQYSNGTCSSINRTAVTLTISPALSAPVSLGNIKECESKPLQTLNANNALSSPIGVTWYSAPTGGVVVTSPTLSAVGSITFYAENTNGNCNSLSRTPVTLTIQPAPAAPIKTRDIIECEIAPIQKLNANNALVSTNGVTWYTSSTGSVITTSPILNSPGTITYYAEYLNGNCSSLSRTPVTLTIIPALRAPVSSGDIVECEQITKQTLNANTALSNIPGVIWYTASSGGSVITSPTLNDIGTITYYAEALNSITGCTSLNRTPVTLKINAAPRPPTGIDITECQVSPSQTLDANKAIVSSEGKVVWYSAAKAGSIINSPVLNGPGAVTYYAEAVNEAGCSSLSRTRITLTIKPTPVITNIPNTTRCNGKRGDPISFSSTLNGTEYSWKNSNPSIGIPADGTGNIPSFIATNNTNAAAIATITVTPSINGCVGTSTSFTITVSRPIITNTPLFQQMCSGQYAQPIVFTSNEQAANFIWSAKATGVSGYTALSGTGNIPAQMLYATGRNIGTIVYTISAVVNGCEGQSSEYRITVVPLPSKAKTYGDAKKRYSSPKIPLNGNTPTIGSGRWSQSSGPNTPTISDPDQPQTEITGYIPGVYEFNWTLTNGICISSDKISIIANAPPNAVNDNIDSRINNPINGNVGTNDSDPDQPSNLLVYSKVSDPGKGTLTFNADGTFNYIPEPGFVGTQTFIYQVVDADGGRSTATVRLSFYPTTVVTLTASQSEIIEGGQVIITAKLAEPIHEDVIITIKYTGTATNADYRLSGDITILIKAGETTTTQKVIITAIKDDIKESDEIVVEDIDHVSSDYVDIGSGTSFIIHDVFPLTDPPLSKNENPDIKPDPMTSPNGDGLGNEEFFIYNISAFPDNEVVIFNRWGNEVFRIKNYDNNANAFRGRANRGLLTNTQEDLVDGVYYYLIYTRTDGQEQKINRGYVILKRTP